MPISQISNSESGASVRSKLNAAIDAVNSGATPGLPDVIAVNSLGDGLTASAYGVQEPLVGNGSGHFFDFNGHANYANNAYYADNANNANTANNASNGQSLNSLFDGSGGNVYHADNAYSANFANYANNTGFNEFFHYYGHNAGVFIDNDVITAVGFVGNGSGLTGISGTPSWFDATGTGYNAAAAFSLDADGTHDVSVSIGYNSNGSSTGAAIGFYSSGSNNGSASGAYSNGSNGGAAMGFGANGYDFGAAVGNGANGYNVGTAMGLNANGSNNGTAMGANSDGHGLGNFAVGGNDSFGDNAVVPNGWTDTIELGRGTATLEGGLNFRGVGIVDYNAGAPKLVIASAGTITNNNAAAGNLGEYVSASVVQGSATALTTATPKTVISIDLTAGDWDVTGIGSITGASTGTAFDVALGTTNNSFTGTVLGDTRCQTPTVSLTGADATLMVPAVRFSLAATTTIYLVVREIFTLGSPAAYGRLSARRVR